MKEPRGRSSLVLDRMRVRGWAGLAALGLLGVAAMSLIAQAQSGALTGRLTDLHSKPLAGVSITLTNATTGLEALTITSKGGEYRFRGLVPGDYALRAEHADLGSGHLESIHIEAGHEAHVQAALAFSRVELTAHATPQITLERPRLGPGPGSSLRPNLETAATEIAGGLTFIPLRSLRLNDTARSMDRTEMARADHGAPTGAEPPVPQPGASADPPGVSVSAPQALVAPTEGLGAAAVPSFEGALAGTQIQAAVGAATVLASLSAAEAVFWAKSRTAVASGIHPFAASETVVTGEQLEDLPLGGRGWENVLLDSPPPSESGEERDESAHGTGARLRSVTVDGGSNRAAFGRDSQASAASRGSALPESDIQEVRLGRPAEIQDESARPETASAESRTGTSTFHGQFFGFNRQAPWAAQNPLAVWVKESAPATALATPRFIGTPYSPADRQFRWGAGAGSAFNHRRIFWFAALDGFHRDHPAVSTVKHPDSFFAEPADDEMQVLGARLGLGSANPVGEGIAAYSGLLESLASLLGPTFRNSREWSGFARFDWKTAERHRFTLEAAPTILDAPGAGLSQSSETYGVRSFGSIRASHIRMLGRWEAYLTPNLLFATQGTLRRSLVSMAAEKPTAFEQTLNINAWGQLPQMRVDSRNGMTIGNPARFGPGSSPDEHIYEAQQSLSWVRNSLLLRAGFQLRHSADATSFLENHTGTYFYSRVENFASDALVFAKYGITGSLDPMHQHNCDQRGKAWRDVSGQLHGLGYLPCYSYYTQTLGPTDWHLSTNDWAGFLTTQWQPAKRFVVTAALRWDREELPPPIALVNNPELPLTQRLPQLGNQWGPRVGLAWGTTESRWPVLRLGYGLYAGRTNNAVLEKALTHTGSPKGDLSLFIRPTDNLQGLGGGAPPFPYVLGGLPGKSMKPGAVEFANSFHNAHIHQGLAGIELTLPGRIFLTASVTLSLARRLPISEDTNYDPGANPKSITYKVVDPTGKGPIKSPLITVPLFATWPESGGRLNENYQQITQLISSSNSTYEAGMLHISRYARHGFSFHARYTYGHAMDWNPNEGAQITGSSVFDPTNLRLEYGTSDLDVRHAISGILLWHAPWKSSGTLGWFANGWSLSGTGQFHSGLPYTMRTEGSIPRVFETNGAMIVGLGPGMNGFGGDDRVYGVGRNTFRHPSTWKADMRVSRQFRMGRGRELQLLAETFNLFNHQNVIQVETVGYSIDPGTQSGTLPRLNFLNGLKANQTEFGQPLTSNAVDTYRERQFDLGLRMRF